MSRECVINNKHLVSYDTTGNVWRRRMWEKRSYIGCTPWVEVLREAYPEYEKEIEFPLQVFEVHYEKKFRYRGCSENGVKPHHSNVAQRVDAYVVYTENGERLFLIDSKESLRHFNKMYVTQINGRTQYRLVPRYRLKDSGVPLYKLVAIK